MKDKIQFMAKYVCSNAKIKCSIGYSPSTLRVLPDGQNDAEPDTVNSRGHEFNALMPISAIPAEIGISSVKGPKEYHRKDNTNGGYCKIPKQVQETQKIKKDGKMVEEPVYEMKDGKQVPKMKTVEETGYYVQNSTDTYNIQY